MVVYDAGFEARIFLLLIIVEFACLLAPQHEVLTLRLAMIRPNFEGRGFFSVSKVEGAGAVCFLSNTLFSGDYSVL